MNVVLAGRYELDQRLGRGGMAEVWRGKDRVLGRRIAVKTVNVADATDLTLGDRLRREAVATAALDHPDIVTVHDAGVDGETAFLVMELATGRTLAALLADGPLSLAEAVRIAGRVAGALAAAHAAGIVHRDIKPANIMVDGEKITVVDFGIAAIEFQAVTSLTAPGTTLGTAEYMAPEQARAEPATAGTDMYSFGCLLTAMVAGRPPFTAESPVAILHHHAYIQPPRLRSLRADVPEELDALVGALLDKDAGVRPTAVEAYERLARIAEQLAPPAVQAPPSGGSGGTLPAMPPVARPAVPAAAAPAVPTPAPGISPPTAAGPTVVASRAADRSAPLAGGGACAARRSHARGRHARRHRRAFGAALAAAVAGIAVSATATGFAASEPVGKVLATQAAKSTVVESAVVAESVEAPLATAVPAVPVTDRGTEPADARPRVSAQETPPAATGTEQDESGEDGNSAGDQGNGNTGKGQVGPPGHANAGPKNNGG